MLNPTTLIVVYKDELLANLVDKLNNGRINIISWSEKQWLTQKVRGDISDKVLFLDNIKGTNDLIPLLNIEFDKYGVKYGWSGKSAVIYINLDALKSNEDYAAFLEELRTETQLPEEITKSADRINSVSKVDDVQSPLEDEEISNDDVSTIKKGRLVKIKALFKKMSRDKKHVRRQMLCYGVTNFCCHNLDKFLS